MKYKMQNCVKEWSFRSDKRYQDALQVNLKDQEIQGAGAIESNVNQVIASRFKKKG